MRSSLNTFHSLRSSLVYSVNVTKLWVLTIITGIISMKHQTAEVLRYLCEQIPLTLKQSTVLNMFFFFLYFFYFVSKYTVLCEQNKCVFIYFQHMLTQFTLVIYNTLHLDEIEVLTPKNNSV